MPFPDPPGCCHRPAHGRPLRVIGDVYEAGAVRHVIARNVHVVAKYRGAKHDDQIVAFEFLT
jgi:hypothetical protein